MCSSSALAKGLPAHPCARVAGWGLGVNRFQALYVEHGDGHGPFKRRHRRIARQANHDQSPAGHQHFRVPNFVGGSIRRHQTKGDKWTLADEVK